LHTFDDVRHQLQLLIGRKLVNQAQDVDIEVWFYGFPVSPQ
jgi:hypothetical protein